MRSLFRFLIRNYGFLLFILLEVISFVLLFNYNNYQKVKFLNSANSLSASVYNSYNSVFNYFSLVKINKELAMENARLKSFIKDDPHFTQTTDSIFFNLADRDTNYQFTSAQIINNSVNKQLNYITLNKGEIHGIKPDQAIISPQGIVGVITNVSRRYSMGLSLLNKRWSVSAKLKKSGFYGSLLWDGEDFKYANLMEIPFHIQLQHGDTVVTSGYSSIFPEGILIGTVQSFEQPEGENYYTIQVKLATNFKSVSFVEVIENKHKSEQINLKNRTENDSRSN